MSKEENSKNKEKKPSNPIRTESISYQKSKIKWEIRRNEDPDIDDD